MSSKVSLQTLDLILEDISAEINLAINALDSFGRDIQAPKKLAKALSHLDKARGIFELLEMPAASRLVTDAIKITKGLKKSQALERSKLLEVLSTSLVGLIRYVEYVNQKNAAAPEVLLPTINYLRSVINASHLEESCFFECDINVPRSDKDIPGIISEVAAAKSRHYRQQYQIGLIEVLRQTNLQGGLKMMQKALVKLDSDCIRPSSPNLWWVAQMMMAGYLSQKISLTQSRLKLFSRLDRQIRNIENKNISSNIDAKKETRKLAKDMLYLAWISDLDTADWNALVEHFKLSSTVMDDASIRIQQQHLKGPSEKDYHSIAEALSEEVNKIEKALLALAQNKFNQAEYKLILKQMVGLNNLLKILQVDEQSVRLTVAIDLVKNALQMKQLLSEKDNNILFLVLKSINSAVSESKLAHFSGHDNKQRKRISPAKLKICEKTEYSVKQLINEFGELSKQAVDSKRAKKIETLLNEIDLGFKQLNVKKALPIIDVCQQVWQLFKEPSSDLIATPVLEYFADIISSFEFYLETLKFTAEPSSRILEFAEVSMHQLQKVA